ncbi:nucleoside phosphorylase [Desulfocicer niacini]
MSFPTLSDLNSPSLVPPVGVGKAPDLSPLAVMISTVPDVRYIKKSLGQPRSRPFFMGELFSTPVTSGACPDQNTQDNAPGASMNHFTTFMENQDQDPRKKATQSTVMENTVSFAGPYMGAPYAAMMLETFIARGVRQIIIIGWCGSISPTVNIGDILMPDAAISHEGTSMNYMDSPEDFPVIYPPAPPSSAMGLAGNLSGFLHKRKIPFKKGYIWTTDAIYRETRQKVNFFHSRGALAVEMECSALFAVAAYRGVELVPLLVVSDDLCGTRWKPAFKTKAFAHARKVVNHAIIDFCGQPEYRMTI